MKRNQSKKARHARLSSKRTVSKKNVYGKPSRKKAARRNTGIDARPALLEVAPFELPGLGPRSGGQAGDLQGLSATEGAASESVEELLEEGNAFEAEVVQGVEDADRADEREVETHETLEDDVPEEYRSKDL